jgi:hypothetical protein
MSSPELGPLGELILRAGVVHLALELDSLLLLVLLLAGLSRGRGWEFEVEVP